MFGKLIAALRPNPFEQLDEARQSQHHLDEVFIGVYGNYAVKLLRLQLDMIHALDRHRRGNKQTVEVRHVNIHSGGQGVVGRMWRDD
jgi:hypothetical protein